MSIFCCTHLCLLHLSILSLVHPFPPFLNRIFSMHTCVAALPEHSCSAHIHSMCVLFSGRTIFWANYCLHVSMLCPPLQVPKLFGLLSFLLCIPFFTILSGLLLNPSSPSLNILSIGISALLHLSQAHWLSFTRQGFILLSVYKEMSLLSCKATCGAG